MKPYAVFSNHYKEKILPIKTNTPLVIEIQQEQMLQPSFGFGTSYSKPMDNVAYMLTQSPWK